MQEGHLPVMPDEVLETLAPRPGSLQIDATVGGGGHTERILEAASPDGRVLGLDADPAAIDRVADRLARFGDRLVLRRRTSGELADGRAGGGLRGGRRGAVRPRPVVVPARRPRARLRVPGRRPARHALRHDAAASPPRSSSRPSSADELAALFRKYGEEPAAWRIAKAIVEPPGRPRRSRRPRSSRRSSSGSSPATRAQRRRIHPATRVFQALRIAVNEELDALEDGLAAARRPAPARAAASSSSSYHSLEDRIVKRFLAAERRGCTCPPEAPVCVCGKRAAPPPRDPAVADPDRRRDRPPTRAPAARGSAPPSGSRRSEDEDATDPPDRRTAHAHPQPRRSPGDMPAPATEEESREQAPSGQPPQGLWPPPARAARAAPARPPPGRPGRGRPRRRRRAGIVDRLAFLDPRTPRLRYALGDWHGRLPGRAAARPIVLPRRPRVGTCGAAAVAATLPRRRARSAVRARRGASRISLLLAAIVVAFAAAFFSLSQDIRVSATGYELDRLATQQRRLDARAERPPQRAEPPGQGARHPQAGDRRRPRPAARAARRPGPLGDPDRSMLGRTDSRTRALILLLVPSWSWRGASACASRTGRCSGATSCRRWRSGSRRCATRSRPTGARSTTASGTVVLATSVQRDRLAANPKLLTAAAPGRRWPTRLVALLGLQGEAADNLRPG